VVEQPTLKASFHLFLDCPLFFLDRSGLCSPVLGDAINTLVNNFNLANKQALQVLVEAGAEVSSVAYNPNLYTAPVGYPAYPGTSPETLAIAAGWVQYYKEATANLIEVIYTR